MIFNLSDNMNKIVVIGYPVEHSLSPAMQNAALYDLRLENKFFYDKLEVKPSKLIDFVKRIRSREIFGANVTIPHKVSVYKLMDMVTSEAEFVGSVNTIYFEAGKIIGHSTDGNGCMKAIEENNINLYEKKVVLLGAGGAARAIAFALTKKKANITILNRTLDKATQLCAEIKTKTNKIAKSGTLDQIKESLKDCDVLINCTSIGMKGKEETSTLVKTSDYSKPIIVMDLVYNPIQTIFLKEAKKAGCKTIDGLAMLVYQGAESLEIWTEKKPSTAVMRRALIDELAFLEEEQKYLEKNNMLPKKNKKK
ncbi:MAG: shikimate dehydrogenase [archaeon]